MAGKYTPLKDYLRRLPAEEREVRLSFAELETILGSALPASAYEDERWWRHPTEANHVSPRAWAQAGWRIAGLDVQARWVKLERTSG